MYQEIKRGDTLSKDHTVTFLYNEFIIQTAKGLTNMVSLKACIVFTTQGFR